MSRQNLLLNSFDWFISRIISRSCDNSVTYCTTDWNLYFCILFNILVQNSSSWVCSLYCAVCNFHLSVCLNVSRFQWRPLTHTHVIEATCPLGWSVQQQVWCVTFDLCAVCEIRMQMLVNVSPLILLFLYRGTETSSFIPERHGSSLVFWGMYYANTIFFGHTIILFGTFL